METIYVLTLFSLLLLLCICSSKVSTWIKMPVLIVFLGIGMLIDLPEESLMLRISVWRIGSGPLQ